MRGCKKEEKQFETFSIDFQTLKGLSIFIINQFKPFPEEEKAGPLEHDNGKAIIFIFYVVNFKEDSFFFFPSTV